MTLNSLPIVNRFGLMNEYGCVFTDSIAQTPAQSKAQYDAAAQAQNEQLPDFLKLKSADGYPFTADEWLKDGGLVLVRFTPQFVEGKESWPGEPEFSGTALQAALDAQEKLCADIEALAASPEQTALSIKASAVASSLRAIIANAK